MNPCCPECEQAARKRQLSKEDYQREFERLAERENLSDEQRTAIQDGIDKLFPL